MYTLIISMLAFFVAIFILVAFHEYGHYKIAKLCGVKVLKFSIGFGPAIFKKRDKSGTDFIIAPIPLGGFVKMLDERESDIHISEQDKDKEFSNKHPLKKIAVVLAGPFFNFILAFVVFYFMFLYGIEVERPVIQYIEPGSIAARAGIEANQEIISIDNKSVTSFSDLQVILASKLGTSGNIEVKTKRFNINNNSHSDIEVNSYNLVVNDFYADVNKEPISRKLGIWLLPKTGMPLLVNNVSTSTNANLGGLKEGDVITKFNSNLINDWNVFLDFIKAHPGENINLDIIRESVRKNILVTIGEKEDEVTGNNNGYLGISFGPPMYYDFQNYGIINSFVKSYQRTIEYISQTFYMIYKLIVGEVGTETIRGPVMVAKAAGLQIQLGISNFLNFLGIISIGLGVINLLPIPVLDGGHLVYHLYELITRKKASALAEKLGLVIGLCLLFIVMSMAFYNDYRFW